MYDCLLYNWLKALQWRLQIYVTLTSCILIPDSLIVQIVKVRYFSDSVFCLMRKLSWKEVHVIGAASLTKWT